MLDSNLVPWRPPGLVVALQYWAGDAARALRLARLIADIEPEYRSDLILVLVRRHDLDFDAETAATVMHCNTKMVTYALRSETVGAGHPDGSNALWDGTMAALAERWRAGDLNFPFVFTAEADGCPLAHDWAIRLLREHQRALLEGKHVTGPLMRLPFAHVNGTLIANLGWWLDHPSLRATPTGYAWDLHHRETFVASCRQTQEIKNIYGATGWTGDQLGPMSNETAWLASTKDASAIRWAEKNITAVARAGTDVDPVFPWQPKAAASLACPGCRRALIKFTEDSGVVGPDRFFCDNLACDELARPVPAADIRP